MDNMMSSFARRIVWGMGVATLALIFTPKAKKMTKPMMQKSVDGAKTLVEKGKEVLEGKKEVKAKTEKEPQMSNQEQDLFEEEGFFNEEIEKNDITELQKTIAKLQAEIEELKARQNY
jgi:uncharacterized small protein (DUF1192 family)